MCAVDLDDGFNNALFYPLHTVEFFIQDAACFLWVNRFKIIVFPLNVHHDGKGALGMASLFRGNLMGTGNGKVSACPEPDIVR